MDKADGVYKMFEVAGRPFLLFTGRDWVTQLYSTAAIDDDPAEWLRAVARMARLECLKIEDIPAELAALGFLLPMRKTPSYVGRMNEEMEEDFLLYRRLADAATKALKRYE